jgi:hypothetical protein
MNFKLDISTDSKDANIKDKCLAAVQEVLEKDGEYFGAGYATEEEGAGLVKAAPVVSEQQERERKIVIEGMMNFSFGKNGQGLTDELIQIGELVKTLSKDNHIYIEDSFIDACDDVYDLKFHITPHEENKWMMEKNAFGNNEK